MALFAQLCTATVTIAVVATATMAMRLMWQASQALTVALVMMRSVRPGASPIMGPAHRLKARACGTIHDVTDTIRFDNGSMGMERP